MAGVEKIDFPALLEVGLHPMSLPDLRRICVDNINHSTVRSGLMDALEAICGELSALSISSEILVNGSFVTSKIDPGDVDFVVMVDADPTSSESQLNFLDNLANQIFEKCHSFVVFLFPPGHIYHIQSQVKRNYWIKWFSSNRKHEVVKGLPVVRTP